MGFIGYYSQSTNGYSNTPTSNRNWDFQSERTSIIPEQFVNLYCKARPPFTYEELESNDQANFRFSKRDQRQLQFLFQLGIIHLNFNPVRFYRNFSLDGFWVYLPKEVMQFKVLLDYLPSTNIFKTKQATQL